MINSTHHLTINALKAIVIITTFIIIPFYQHLSAQSNSPLYVGSTITGNHPKTPFLYTLTFYGERPMLFESLNVPNGIALNPETGILSGKLEATGNYTFTIKATNEYGSCTQDFTISIGDTLLYTPPMGWNSWNVFAEDINEQLIMEMADAMVSSGMRDVGYHYINLDDFWQANTRDSLGRPVADSTKFPNGIPYLANYLHERGLKLGIYSCAGKMTCGERFGGYTYEEIDAKTYAEWGVDLLKYDYCYAPYSKKKAIERYGAMGKALKEQDRTIVFGLCEWGLRKPWQWGNEVGGHYWRITPDIFDTWEGKHVWHKSTESIVRKAIRKDKYAAINGWNDLDMLIVGNDGKGKATSNNGQYKGMTTIEYESHMKLWCLFKSPLLAGCDLRNMDSSTLQLLTNIDLIAIQQDQMAAPVHVLYKQNGIYILSRNLSNNQTVIAIWNSRNKEVEFTTKRLGKMMKNEKLACLDQPGYQETFLIALAELITLKAHETVLIRFGLPH